MSTHVAGHLLRKRIVRDINGNIVDMLDEAGGGWIVKQRQVVNEELWNKYQQKLEDAKQAATAPAQARVDETLPDRNVNFAQMKKQEELEAKVNEIDTKLDAILKALNQ
jgi:hypothetical protein